MADGAIGFDWAAGRDMNAFGGSASAWSDGMEDYSVSGPVDQGGLTIIRTDPLSPIFMLALIGALVWKFKK